MKKYLYSLKNIFHIYKIRLFELNYSNIQFVDARIQVSFLDITKNNYYQLKELIKDDFYIKDFRRMLDMGDRGIYVCFNNQNVGYGWAKTKGSKDYFFHIKHCYLCRFFIHPDFRGLNIFPATLLHMIKKMNNEGYKQFYAGVETSNYASLRGLSKIGFKFLANITFIRILKITLKKHELN